MNQTVAPPNRLQTFGRQLAILRIIFGLVWLTDAVLKYQPAFYHGILQTVQGADAGEPRWLNPWFHLWFHIIGSAPHLFAIIIIVAESLTAVSLLLGIARRLNYVLGALLSFLIWSVAEGFGGPYVAGSTDIGAGFIYVIVFLLLYVADGLIAPRFSFDPWLAARISWWPRIAGDHALDSSN